MHRMQHLTYIFRLSDLVKKFGVAQYLTKYQCYSNQTCTSDSSLDAEDGKTDVVANDLGDRTTPCVVAYTDHDMAVGKAAKQGNIRNAQNTISHIKTVLGRNWEDTVVQNYIQRSPVKTGNIKDEIEFEVEFKGQRKKVGPRDIAKAIYNRMLETARSHGDGDIHDSVLAVPTDTLPGQRKAFSECAEAVGFNVLRVINEPVAALLAYDIGQNDNTLNCNVLVFRIGGDSSDVSIVRTQNGLYRIMGSANSTELAGSKFTNALADYLAQEFYRQYKLDVKESKRSLNKLRQATEICKHTLSTLGNAQYSIDSLHEGVDHHGNVSRARFESLCGPLVQLCSCLIENACTESGIKKTDIDKVVLCGGGTRIPLIQKTVVEYLTGVEVLSSIPPDEVIAIGAAKQAAILTGNDESEVQENAEENEIECIPKAICIKVVSAENSPYLYPIFHSLTPLPSRRHETVNLPDNQTSLRLDLCECEDLQSPEKSSHLAKVVMNNLPPAAKVTITFHLRREGSLHVTCREDSTDVTESLTIDVSS
ncbi:hypothetical protein FSP39_022624 [Pinctada imbricata]|uniref:Heat shock 70 kDa protein 14 n=1 Tax=Pinctada imbricata TaxID=66713 RepID=A0AA88YES9_PINIB|nr:hypothetical protein FSP39_022624 [Pinctada imbricata]